ncbi:MAG: MBL fold metallo-hydrolase [Flavobacterium sp.]
MRTNVFWETLRSVSIISLRTENKYPGAPAVQIFEVKNNEDFLINGTKIVPVEVDHANLQVFGYRIQDFVYLTDVKSISDTEIEKLKGVKVLVVNALREEAHHSHFSLQDALDFIHLVQPERAYLTHISHLLGFHEVVQQRLPENVFLAYDNLKITI